jgi:hypothetical protein
MLIYKIYKTLTVITLQCFDNTFISSHFICCSIVNVGSVYIYGVLVRMIYPILSCNYISKFELVGYENITENEMYFCIVWMFIFLYLVLD